PTRFCESVKVMPSHPRPSARSAWAMTVPISGIRIAHSSMSLNIGTMRCGRTLAGMPDAALDAALDELYAAEPSDFVTTRKRLVAELRAAGAKESAKQLQGARRPGTAAWALN